MAIKWKNIIKKGIVAVRYSLLLGWICSVIVFGVLAQNDNLMHYENVRDAICKTEYTNSQEFLALVQDAFRGMDEVYTEDLEGQLRDAI